MLDVKKCTHVIEKKETKKSSDTREHLANIYISCLIWMLQFSFQDGSVQKQIKPITLSTV